MRDIFSFRVEQNPKFVNPKLQSPPGPELGEFRRFLGICFTTRPHSHLARIRERERKKDFLSLSKKGF